MAAQAEARLEVEKLAVLVVQVKPVVESKGEAGAAEEYLVEAATAAVTEEVVTVTALLAVVGLVAVEACWAGRSGQDHAVGMQEAVAAAVVMRAVAVQAAVMTEVGKLEAAAKAVDVTVEAWPVEAVTVEAGMLEVEMEAGSAVADDAKAAVVAAAEEEAEAEEE